MSRSTLEKVEPWVKKLPASIDRICARDAGPDEPALLDVPLNEHERESIAQDIADALESALECADRAVTFTLVAYRGTEAQRRLVVRMKPNAAAADLATMPTKEDNGRTDVDIIKVLLTHNQAMTGQLVSSVQAITGSLSSVLRDLTASLNISETRRREAEAIANDAVMAASSVATEQKRSGMDRVMEIIAERMLPEDMAALVTNASNASKGAKVKVEVVDVKPENGKAS